MTIVLSFPDIFTVSEVSEEEYSRMNDSEKLFHMRGRLLVNYKASFLFFRQYAEQYDKEFYDRYRIFFDRGIER